MSRLSNFVRRPLKEGRKAKVKLVELEMKLNERKEKK